MESPADSTPARIDIGALVIKGGGPKGLALVGAYEILEEYFSFGCYAGTSAGSILAILLCADFSSGELKKALEEKPLHDLIGSYIHWVSAPFRLFFSGGLFHGTRVSDWISKLVTDKKFPGDLNPPTLVDLDPKGDRLAVYATQQGAGVFEISSKSMPKMTIGMAAQASSSIPIFFVPPLGPIYFFDGGALANFPLQQFQRTHPAIGENFIGLYLKPVKSDRSTGLSRFFWSLPLPNVVAQLFDIVVERDEREIADSLSSRIVKIDPGQVGLFSFNLGKDDSELLILRGRTAALRYLSQYGADRGLQPAQMRQVECSLERACAAETALAGKLSAAKAAGRWGRRVRGFALASVWAVLLSLLLGVVICAVNPTFRRLALLDGRRLVNAVMFRLGQACPGDMRLISQDGLTFCMDPTETTVDMYNECSMAGACRKRYPFVFWEGVTKLQARRWQLACSQDAGDPANCVFWADARDYCASRGTELPSVAEWHAAMRASRNRPKAGRSLRACGNGLGSAESPESWLRKPARPEGYHAGMYLGTDGFLLGAPVGHYHNCFQEGAVLDLHGNVSEWSRDEAMTWSRQYIAGLTRDERNSLPLLLRDGRSHLILGTSFRSIGVPTEWASPGEACPSREISSQVQAGGDPTILAETRLACDAFNSEEVDRPGGPTYANADVGFRCIWRP